MNPEAEGQELRLAAQVQRTMLPPRSFVGDRTFYTTLWRPKDAVSGDFYEALPIAGGDWLYVLGDVQGHGTVAAMAMMAVQGFLRQLSRLEDLRELGPADVANALQGFVASNLGAVSYLTALVCFHRPAEGVVDWISCGAPESNAYSELIERGGRVKSGIGLIQRILVTAAAFLLYGLITSLC